MDTKTSEWHERRRQSIGGSDIAAILGVDRYKNAGDVWLEKTGQLEPSKDTDDTRRGTALEGAILSLFEMERSVPVARKVYITRDIFAAELDGAIPRKGGILWDARLYGESFVGQDIANEVEAVVEAKSAATVHRESQEPGAELLEDPGWGPGPTDVPFRVIAQVTHQMYCAGCTTGWVPVFSPGYRSFKFDIKRVDYSQALVDQIVEAGHEFWGYVERREMPPNVTPTLDALKRRHRVAGNVRPLGPEATPVFELWRRLNEERKLLEKREKLVQADVINLLGGDEEGILEDGRSINYFSQFGGRYVDYDDLQAELEAIQRRIQQLADPDRGVSPAAFRQELQMVDLLTTLAKHTNRPEFRVLRHKKAGKR